MLACLGYGKTVKAVSKKFKCDIFDDNCSTIFSDEFGNTIYPTAQYDKKNYSSLLVSPGVSPNNMVVKKSKDILISDYDLIDDNHPFSIWISGTNGKTTTTQMIEHLLNDSVSGGNIGTPIIELDRNKSYWVVETSSFTLHYAKSPKPDIYILLPITQDHISWHGSFDNYELDKLKPLRFMDKNSIVILPKKYQNIDSKATKIVYENSIDLANKFDIDISRVEFNEPFLLDAILALVVTKLTQKTIDYSLINSYRVDSFKMEKIIDFQNRVWINDSKATNIDATIQALKSLDSKKIYLIIGGDDKGSSLDSLFLQMQNYNITLFIIGKNSEKLFYLSQKYNIKSELSNSIDIAVDKIDKIHNSSSIAILSPAAASLDQFNSYKHRGEFFNSCINSLK